MDSKSTQSVESKLVLNKPLQEGYIVHGPSLTVSTAIDGTEAMHRVYLLIHSCQHYKKD